MATRTTRYTPEFRRQMGRIVLMLLLSASALIVMAAEDASPQSIWPSDASGDDELDEVRVLGAKPSRKASEIIAWMQRLVGQFAYEGFVDPRSQGGDEDRASVRGQADCTAFDGLPAVQCEIRVLWDEVRGENSEEISGVISNLNPAVILYGFEPDELGIRFMQVDRKGIAEPALGLVVGDTLMARAPCADQLRNCYRVTRITAAPDMKLVATRIDIEVDHQRSLSYRLVMRRVPLPPLLEAPRSGALE